MAKIKVRSILEAKLSGLSNNEIIARCQTSCHSIKDVVSRAGELGIMTPSDIPIISDDELYRMFFPERNTQSDVFMKPDYDYVHKELNRVGVTLQTLWNEYKIDCQDENSVPMSYQTYCRGYSSYVGRKGFSNHISHKAGDRIEVDWSGPTMHYTDREKGRDVTVYLFVADLVSSRLAYVEPCLDMKESTWLQCHINMWEYYGGVSRILVCDNLKTGVQSHPKDGEIILTRDYEMLAEHYGTAIMPCAVRAPRQKNSAENTVYNAALSIIAKLRDVEFYSFFALKNAVRRQLEAFNDQPFQKREGSRRSDFIENEKEYLRPLPSTPFEIGQWFYGRKVQPNCHVSFERNWYSVPFAYQGCTVDIKATPSVVSIYSGLSMVKRHSRFLPGLRNRYCTDAKDMPPGAGFTEWDENRIMKWASSIGPATAEVISRILSSHITVEHTFNAALAVLHLTNRYEKERIEYASGIALAKVNSPRYSHIKTILSSNLEDASIPSPCESQKPKGILKGAEYFKKFGGGK